jgi:hypothetical protein
MILRNPDSIHGNRSYVVRHKALGVTARGIHRRSTVCGRKLTCVTLVILTGMAMNDHDDRDGRSSGGTGVAIVDHFGDQ